MRLHTSLRSRAGVTTLWILAAALPAFSQTFKTVYTIQTFAGGNWVGDGGPALQALLTQPEGIAVDTRGFVYVADPADHRVRRISPEGIIQTIAGNGSPGFSGDNGPAESATLNAPYGLCFDRAGNLYIADLGNARVRRISADGRIATIAGGGSIVPGGDGDGGMSTEAKLSAPRNVAADANGNLFISDFSAQRVFQVNAAGVITTVAGSGTAGFSGDGAAAKLAQLAYPAGLAIDAQGVLYIADSGNRRVRRVAQGVISTVTTGALNSPTGLAVDGAGNLYVQDGRATTLRLGSFGSLTNLPLGGGDIAISAVDQVYATGSRVVKKLAGNNAQTIAGVGTSLFGGDGGPPANARLNGPAGLYRDYLGNFYIVDSKNLRVRKINTLGLVSTFAGDGQATGLNGSLATSVHLVSPLSVAADNRGNFYVSDPGANRIRRIAPDGSSSTLAGSDTPGFSGDGWLALYAQVSKPAGLTVDQNDNIYFADSGNNRVRKITPEGLIYTIAGGSLLESLGDGGPATQARLLNPTAVALDTAGNLFISDTGNGRIRRIDAKGIITSYGNKFVDPRGLRALPGGDLLVADAGDHTIRRISTSGKVSILAGTGARGFSGDGGPAESAALDTPLDIWIDREGAIFISDSGNNRVRKITAEMTVVAQALTALSIVHSATLREQPIAAGQLVTIFGSGFGSKDGVTGRPQADGILPNILGGVQVLFDGRPAPLLYVQDSQINLQVPYGLAGRSQTDVTVLSGSGVNGRATVPVQPVSLGLFTLATGSGQAIALNEDGSANATDRPAHPGSIIVLYATGDGVLLSDSIDGRAGGVGSFRTTLSVDVGGLAAEVLYAGRAPGLLGVMQINAKLPLSTTLTGVQEVVVTLNGGRSQPGVTLALN